MPLPTHRSIDSMFGLLGEGYTFVSRRVDRLGADAFRARLGGRRVTFCLGRDAVEMFYAPGRMTRRGAQPLSSRLLQDAGAVQVLDGADHRERKRLLLSTLSGPSVARLCGIFERRWQTWLDGCAPVGEVVLVDHFRELLVASACEWAGIELAPRDVTRRARQLSAIVVGTGSIGPRLLRGWLAKRAAMRWAQQQVRGARQVLRAHDQRPVARDTPLALISLHEEGGEALSPSVAAAELLNLLRPIVAVAHFMAFAALALHEHAAAAGELCASPDGIPAFVHEVRRYYPFFPLVGGRALEAFEWRGQRFEKGSWFLLDLYGTNHDPDLWERPGSFLPQRFSDGALVSQLVPQGGGDPAHGHRCAGDDATVQLVGTAVRLLLAMRYEVPPQDLSVSLSRIPALPASGVVISNVRRR